MSTLRTRNFEHQSFKSIVLFAAVFAIATTARADDLPLPIAEASTGMLLCSSPNLAMKTCITLAGYHIDVHGMIVNTATVLVSANPAITMETAKQVVIKNGRVCGPLRREDLEDATFKAANGKTLPSKEADALRQQVAQGFNSILGHEICTAYVRQGTTLIAKATDDGVAVKIEPAVIWVSPDEGYRVAP